MRTLILALVFSLIPSVAFAQGWAPRPPSSGGGGALTSCPNGVGDISTGCYVASISGSGGTGGAVNLGATVVLTALAGAGSADFSSWTGPLKFPTGNVSWVGASGKTLSLVGLSTFTLTGGAASTWGLTSGALTLNAAGGENLQFNGATYEDIGVTTGSTITWGANINVAGAAGTGALNLGGMTGDSTLPTGALSWSGAVGKTGFLVAGGNMSLGGSASTELILNSSNVEVGQPLAGISTAVQYGVGSQSLTSACGSGAGSVTLAAGVYIFPYINLTGSLGGNCAVILPTVAGACWYLDTTGVTFNAHQVQPQANGHTWGSAASIGNTTVTQLCYSSTVGHLQGVILSQ